jgi:multiple sugar transport system permease protein
VILPQHQLFADLRLHNSYPGLILPGLAGPFGVFFMTQYFRAIPRDLDEAALLDGASASPPSGRCCFRSPCRAGDARRFHLPRHLEQLLVAAHLRHQERHVHADGGLAAAQMNYAQTSGSAS